MRIEASHPQDKGLKKLSVRAAGFLLVALPATFQLIIVLVLAVMLLDANQKTADKETSRLVLLRKTEFESRLKNSRELMEQLIITPVDGTRARLSKELRLAEKSLASLDSALGKKKIVTELQESEIHSRFDDFKNALELAGKDGGSRDLALILANVERASEKIAVQLERIAQNERKQISTSSQTESDFRILGGALLAVSVFGNIATSLLLAHRYGIKIVEDIEAIMDNARLLGAGQVAAREVSGRNELAELNDIIVETSIALAESRARESELLQKLASGKEQLEELLQNLPTGVLVIDKESRTLFANSEMCRLSESDLDELVGLTVDSVIPKPKETLPGEDSFVSRLTTRSGETKTCKVTTTAIEDRKILSVIDISEEARIEKLKQDFVSMITHELRTPLTSIQVTLEMLASGMYGELSESATNQTVRARTASVRLLKLINDLLTLDKLQSDEISLEKGMNNIEELVDSSLAVVESLLESKSIKVERDTESLIVDCDGDKIVQVVLNLLGNAAKFSPEQSTVQVSAKREGRFVKISVSDQGPGVPDSMSEAIFEKFKQVNPQRAQDKSGSGLGLAITKAIVIAHGGSIGVTSKDSRTNFWFTLPCP